MPLVLYNTFIKGEQEFVPIAPGKVKMYTCGPTVYGRPHIGNYSSFLMADLLRRWLEASGFAVTHAKNITDVGHLVADQDRGEDKIEKQARAEKVDPLAVAAKYTEQYLEDERALNFLEPFARPRATESIHEMIAIILALLKTGHAYETEDGIYFSVETFPAYGKLSGNPLGNLLSGARISVDERKRHPADFALWKKTVGENARHLLRWRFPSGERATTEGEDPSAGFPGWHIECSAMAKKILGPQIDIHTGGEDNIFPHHECEIAQSECSGPAPFARIWLHKRRIDMGDEKMSKSLGNVLTLPDVVAKGFDPLDLRFYLLSVHYRTNLTFSWKGMEDAKKARRKIVEWLVELEKAEPSASAKTDTAAADATKNFRAAMDADLNTPGALGAIFTAMNHWHALGRFDDDSLTHFRTFASLVRRTFGCFDAAASEEIPSDVQRLLDERARARASKNFAESDRLRDAIARLGYAVKDTPDGQRAARL